MLPHVIYILNDAEIVALYRILTMYLSPEVFAGTSTKQLELALSKVMTNLVNHGHINISNPQNYITYTKYHSRPKLPAHVTIMHDQHFNQITTNPARAFRDIWGSYQYVPNPVRCGIFRTYNIERYILPKNTINTNLIILKDEELSDGQRKIVQLYESNKYKLDFINEYTSYIDKGVLNPKLKSHGSWEKTFERASSQGYPQSNGEIFEFSMLIDLLTDGLESGSRPLQPNETISKSIKCDIFNKIIAPQLNIASVDSYMQDIEIVDCYDKLQNNIIKNNMIKTYRLY